MISFPFTSPSPGRGIQLFSSTQELTTFLQSHRKIADGVIQEYLERPLLIHNKKFDIRIYMLLARTQPFLSFWSPKGYCRICVGDYVPNDFSDYSIHLTNQAQQKKLGSQYKSTKEETTWTLERLESYLIHIGRVEQGWLKRCLLPRMKQICLVQSRILRREVTPVVGSFELYGCDFILNEATPGTPHDSGNLDPSHNIYLLEMNSNPAIVVDTEVLQRIIPPTVSQAIDIVEGSHGPTLASLQRPFGDTDLFEILIDESRNWQWSGRGSKDFG